MFWVLYHYTEGYDEEFMNIKKYDQKPKASDSGDHSHFEPEEGKELSTWLEGGQEEMGKMHYFNPIHLLLCLFLQLVPQIGYSQRAKGAN